VACGEDPCEVRCFNKQNMLKDGKLMDIGRPVKNIVILSATKGKTPGLMF
jgi:hypothetical protein